MIVECTASALIIRTLPVLSPATDTTRRMIKGQRALVYGSSLDVSWVYVQAPAANGWVSRQHTEVTDETPTPEWPEQPAGLAAIRRVFGPPGAPLCHAGRVVLPVPVKLSWKPTEHARIISCHKYIEGVFQSVFDQIYQRDLWGQLEDWGGIYNFRTVRGRKKKLSTHSWGIAVDLNVVANPLGAKPALDGRIVAIFEDHGFVWGGRWTRPDGGHFQYCSGY